MHKSEAQTAAKTVQSLVKPNALTEILGTPTPRENPNRAPRGVVAAVSLTMPDTALKQPFTKAPIPRCRSLFVASCPKALTPTWAHCRADRY